MTYLQKWHHAVGVIVSKCCKSLHHAGLYYNCKYGHQTIWTIYDSNFIHPPLANMSMCTTNFSHIAYCWRVYDATVVNIFVHVRCSHDDDDDYRHLCTMWSWRWCDHHYDDSHHHPCRMRLLWTMQSSSSKVYEADIIIFQSLQLWLNIIRAQCNDDDDDHHHHHNSCTCTVPELLGW